MCTCSGAAGTLLHDIAAVVRQVRVAQLSDTLVTPLIEVHPGHDEAATFDPGRSMRSGIGMVMLCGAYLLDRSRSHPLLAELPDVVHLPARVGLHPALRAAVDLLGAELERSRPGVDGVVPALLDLLLLYILRAWFEEQSDRDTASGWVAALHDQPVAAALRAIHGDPGRPWTVEQLGTKAGLSRAAFARRFTTLVGQPPLAYLTWWRMTIAARLLHDSDAPLGAIARQVGYTSEFAFAHAFKREHGSPPGGFRRSRGAKLESRVAQVAVPDPAALLDADPDRHARPYRPSPAPAPGSRAGNGPPASKG